MKTEAETAVIVPAVASVAVKNTLPAEIVAISPETLKEALDLVVEANALKVQDVASLESANDIFRRVDVLAKRIGANRLEITRPIDALKKAIITAEEQATEPLLSAKKDLGNRILVCQKELQRIRDEAERKAREEAEEKARAERKRLEEERQAKIKKQQEEHDAQVAAAKAEADLFGTDAPVIEAPVAPPPVVVIPEVIPPGVSIPVMPKSAVRVSSRQVLVVDDANLIPAEIAGVRLLVPDESAILKLLKSGVKIPGCRIDTVSGIASNGGRK